MAELQARKGHLLLGWSDGRTDAGEGARWRSQIGEDTLISWPLAAVFAGSRWPLSSSDQYSRVWGPENGSVGRCLPPSVAPGRSLLLSQGAS